MTLRTFLIAALLVLLAGCSSSPPADAPAGADDDAENTQVPTAVVPVAPKLPQPVTATCEMTRTNLGTTTGYGLNIDRVATDINECPLELLFDGNTSWASAGLVEATWTSQASQTGTDLWIESDACQPTPLAPCDRTWITGATSPLRLEVSGAQLRAVEGHNALVMVSGQGVVVQLVYTLHVTLFPDDVVPAGFTAIA